MMTILRTTASNKDFKVLVTQLDAYLKVTDGDEHAFYNQFNSIEQLQHVIVAYKNSQPVGCGAFKAFDTNTVEVKRMFTLANHRNKGIAASVLKALELWASELNYKYIVLETGIRQVEAVAFYKKNAYTITENYGQYIGVKNSLCFKKELMPYGKTLS